MTAIQRDIYNFCSLPFLFCGLCPLSDRLPSLDRRERGDKSCSVVNSVWRTLVPPYRPTDVPYWVTLVGILGNCDMNTVLPRS
jgi:hypothetical protein